ncbi:gamma-secretase-activating protein-like [Dysidea avara]|uniref:gamma-secretase-activating protein-like n=1 Tax=Dysidea avara TaxID=196820 RepID=UPI00333077E7
MDQPRDVSEPIIRFKESYDFNQLVNKHLIKDLQPSEVEEVKTTIKIVGQERNGSYLFSWNQDGGTCIGMHFPNSPIHSVLYKFSEPTNIVSASVNENTSLLAFTIIKEGSDESMFSTYIVNTQSDDPPVPLKLDSLYYHKVLFLNSMGFDFRKLGTVRPEAKLLLIMHKVGVIFYQIHLRTIQNYTVISDEPKEEVITEEIDWYQWDSINQWLYYARFYSPEDKGITIACVDFSQTYHIVVFCLQFKLPYDCFHYIGKTTYYDSPGAFILPQKEVNMQVLYVKDGSWCVCVQHNDGSGQSDDAGSQYKLEYSVFMMHNGHVLKGYVNLDDKAEDGIPLHFMLLGQFVAVYAQGYLFHLLNVGAKSDPCHHLILGKELTPSLPCGTVNPRLTPVLSTTLIGEFDTTFMECSSKITYQCQLNQIAFLDLFKTQNMKLSLIHLALVCLRQPELANSMISSLADNPLSPEVPDIIAEYIVSAAYASMQYECKSLVLKQLPLTTKSTFQGIIAKDNQGRTSALIQCAPMKKFVQQLHGQCEATFNLSHPEELMTFIPEGPLGCLCFNAVLSTSKIERLNLPTLVSTTHASGSMPQLETTASSPTQSRSALTRSGSDSVIGRITATLTGRRRSSHSTSQASETLNFLAVDEEFQKILKEQKEQLTYSCYEFYSKRLPLRLKTIIHNVAKSYTSSLFLQVQIVLDTIWKVVGFSLDNNPVDQPIHSESPAKELLLFELIEAYFLALNQLKLPLPEGFHSFFIIMGYRSLDRLLFMQYLENSVMFLTQRFVDALIADIDNGNDDIIMEIFSHLEPEVVQAALKKWDNAPFNLLKDRTVKFV